MPVGFPVLRGNVREEKSSPRKRPHSHDWKLIFHFRGIISFNCLIVVPYMEVMLAFYIV